MRTRLRDWIIVGVALALMFGVSLGAPDPPAEPPPAGVVHTAPSRLPTGAGVPVQQRPRELPPFEYVDPSRFLLTSPGLDEPRAMPRVLPAVR